MKIKINKEKLVMSITIGISCFALMLVMFMQFKMVNQTDITAIETMKESELKLELASWREKYNELNEKHNEIVAKIEEYKNESVSDAETAKLLEKELEQLNKALGKTDVEGKGIVIQLVDKRGEELGDGAYVDAITAENLLIIVNQLFSAGAEAISINGHRIITKTSIVDIGATEFININSKRIPDNTYVINAIGNQDYLRSAVLGKGGHVDYLKELGHETSVEENDNIVIERYNGEIDSKYID
mgnify:CR=1 FL=1